MSYLPIDLHNRLLEVDNRHCVYCQTAESNTGQPMTVDHIIPQVQGGETKFENLSGEYVSLFHPRQHNWVDHFQWDDSGAILVGLSAVGRVTIIALNMNDPIIVDARRRWVGVGWHPPN